MRPDELRRARAAAQLLGPERAGDAGGVVARLLAVQAQDLSSARLALRARGSRLAARDVDRALTAERSLVVAWLNRGTLHLVQSDDYPWLLPLLAPAALAASARRLAQEGVRDPDRAVAACERALVAAGPLTRPELAARLATHGVPTGGQAAYHVLRRAALVGRVVAGPVTPGGQAFALARDWLGADPPPARLDGDERRAALAELARRYLAGHGPATAADLAGWAGLGVREARAGLEAIAGELADAGGGLVDLARREPPPGRLPARLLPAFDPYLLGWRDGAFAVPPGHARRVRPGGGVVRAVALVDGLAAGTWRRSDGIELDLFGRVGPADRAELEAEAADLARFEGLRSRPARHGDLSRRRATDERPSS